MGKKDFIKFRMNQISIEQFAILADSPSSDSISLGTDINFKTSVPDRLVACLFKTSFFEGEENTPLFVLEIMCQFIVEENNWNHLKSDSGYRFPKGFLCHMAMHTVGTARGVLFCKTEGTPYNALILPPINVESIIDEDIVLNDEQ